MSEVLRGAGRGRGDRYPLRIGGVVHFSTVDWPGKLSCVAFLAGCPWQCPYCQNHELRSAAAGVLGEDDLFSLLERRRGLLDSVVFSGGEPLVQPAVAEAMLRARQMGFEVGLHTCGAYPERLRELLPLLSWVGMDVKAPWETYEAVTGVPGSGELARESLELLLSSGVSLEVRTTWHPDLLSPKDMQTIANALVDRGVRSWAVQAYRHVGTTGELADKTVYPSDMPAGVADLFQHFEFRRA